MNRSRPIRTIRLVAVLFSLSLVLTACDPEQLLALLDGQAATQEPPARAAAGSHDDHGAADPQHDAATHQHDRPKPQVAKTPQAKKTPQPAPTPASTPKPDRAKPPTDDVPSGGNSADLSAVEREVFSLLNAARTKAGQKALNLDAGIVAGAREWSCDMAKSGNFRHADLRSAGVNGENIAWGQQSAGEVHDGWMNSPGHRTNRMNSRWTQYGIGICKDGNGRMYFTERFR